MTIKEKIQDWCDLSLDRLSKEYDKQDRRASGEWEKQLESKIEETNKGYNVQLLGANYTYWMEYGRKPGKFPPINAIRKWIDDKGIIAQGISKNSLAFLISRKISEKGYKGKPLVSNVLTDEWIKELMHSVGALSIENFKKDILKEFTKAT